MRRFGIGFLILATAAVVTTAAAAQDGKAPDPPPSLEYRPPRVVIPEPKAPRPLPPKTVFAEAIGSLGMMTGSFDRPVDVARVEKKDANHETGDFYVLDVGNNRIQMFDRNSNFKKTCGRSGINAGEFDRPTAIALGPVDDTTRLGDDPPIALYVVDTGNHRIQICDPKSMFNSKTTACDCTSWGTRGSGTPRAQRQQFLSPRDIAFTKSEILVLDSGNDRVLFFRYGLPEPGFNRKWDSSTGTTGGTFAKLTSIATSEERSGYIYLLGAGCVVQQFELGGTLVHSWPAIAPESGLCVPARIEVDEKFHYVYVLDAGNSLILSYNPDGLYRWALRGADVPFSRPLGFAVNRDGEEVLVADTENNTVQKFTLR